VDALLVAISELATNSLEHGGGRGRVEMWAEGDSVVCVITDRGHILDPQAGRHRPGPMAPRGRGLWVVRQACNEVRQATTPEGTATRIVVGPEARVAKE
jgi:anti-sigma regulatory factor (Ser/Thr protein kinase)